MPPLELPNRSVLWDGSAFQFQSRSPNVLLSAHLGPKGVLPAFHRGSPFIFSSFLLLRGEGKGNLPFLNVLLLPLLLLQVWIRKQAERGGKMGKGRIRRKLSLWGLLR